MVCCCFRYSFCLLFLNGWLVLVFWLVLFLTAVLIGLHSSSSFVWIEDILILYELNFTCSGIMEFMYSALPTMVFSFSTMSQLELLLTGIWKSFLAPGFNMMTLSAHFNLFGNSPSPCWNIIGWGEVRHPTFVLQATWTIQPGEIMQPFPFIFTTTFSCSWDWIRLTNASILNISIIECLFKPLVKFPSHQLLTVLQ